MDYLLHIETATPVCSVALSKGEKIIGLKETSEENSHSTLLTVFIQQLLDEAGRKASELKAVSVSEGPGSYTGLRIGVSTAKGLCYALNIPLIAISTLRSMANGFLFKDKPADKNFILCPAIDARRMDIYYSLLDPDLKEIIKTSVTTIDATFLDGYKEEVFSFGTGAHKLSNITNIRIFEGNYNSAAFLVSIAYQKYIKKDFEDLAYFEPFYLKEFYSGKTSTNQ